MKKPLFNGILSLFAIIFLLSGNVFAVGGVSSVPKNPLDPENKYWFVYHLGPGEIYNDIMFIRNSMERDATVLVYPADATKSAGGGFGLKGGNMEMEGIGKWIKVSKGEVFVKAGETIELPFTITIPEDAEVGETSGAMMVQEKTVINDGEKSGIQLSFRTGSRIYNTVPGEVIEELTFNTFKVDVKNKKDGKKFLQIYSEIQNTGNVSSSARYVVTITNAFTNEEIEKQESKSIINRNDTLKNTQESKEFPFIGRVKVQLDAFMIKKDGTEKALGTKETFVWIIPVKEIAGGITLILIVFAIYYLRKRKYSGKGWITYKVKEGDDIIKVAAMHNVDWEMLAKTNKIKAPYFLMKGMTILTPRELGEKKTLNKKSKK